MKAALSDSDCARDSDSLTIVRRAGFYLVPEESSHPQKGTVPFAASGALPLDRVDAVPSPVVKWRRTRRCGMQRGVN